MTVAVFWCTLSGRSCIIKYVEKKEEPPRRKFAACSRRRLRYLKDDVEYKKMDFERAPREKWKTWLALLGILRTFFKHPVAISGMAFAGLTFCGETSIWNLKFSFSDCKFQLLPLGRELSKPYCTSLITSKWYIARYGCKKQTVNR